MPITLARARRAVALLLLALAGLPAAPAMAQQNCQTAGILMVESTKSGFQPSANPSCLVWRASSRAWLPPAMCDLL